MEVGISVMEVAVKSLVKIIKPIVQGKTAAQTPKTSHQRKDGSTLTLKDQDKKELKSSWLSMFYT